MKVPRGFSSRFFQSEFLPSFFFLFFSSSPGNEFLSRHHAARSWLEEHESSFERSFANSDHAISLDNHEFPFRRQNAARSSFFFLSIGLLSHCNFPTRFLRSKIGSSQILEILAIFIGGSSLSRRKISRAHIILNRSTTRPSTRVDCDLYAWQGLYFTSFDPLNPVD